MIHKAGTPARVTASGGLITDRWNFVVASFNATTKQLFISLNGGDRVMGTMVGIPAQNPLPGKGVIVVGSAGDLPTGIDELGIWSRVLTDHDIQALYNGEMGRTTPLLPSFLTEYCGNGNVEGTEQCDDGNRKNADSCTIRCSFPGCGDGFVNQPSEQCDDGNLNNSDTCSITCQNIICGDGIEEGTEQCDDRNRINTDACSNACTIAMCGDGIKNQLTEQCDDGDQIDQNSCRNDCTLPVCGDGLMQGAEQCDAGHQTGIVCTTAPSANFSCQYCSFDCKLTLFTPEPVCGNGIIENKNELCDDGNTNVGDGCDANCSTEPGYVCEGNPSYCVIPVCGNGVIEPSEECDDHNQIDTDVCNNRCTINPVCGNGIKENGEQCDDGNTGIGDGCGATCQYENPAYTSDLRAFFGVSFIRGNEVHAGVSVFNAGPANATYRISIPLPPGWTMNQDSTPGSVVQNGIFIFNDTQVRLPGQNITAGTSFNAPGSPCGVTLKATVTPTSSFYDPDMKNNTSEVIPC